MIFLLFFIAFIYSSAGFGGGSMYLSILSQSFPGVQWIRFPALLCNAIASGAGTFNFSIKHWMPWKHVLSLVFCSVPLAMWAASWQLTSYLFLMLLGGAIILAGIALLVTYKSNAQATQLTHNPWWLYLITAGIGVLSGITGIGGGIYLAPVLHHLNWAPAHKIAATTACFIFLNSICTLTVLLWKVVEWQSMYWYWMGAVAIGAILGSAVSIQWLSAKWIRLITALLLIFVGSKILWDLL
jgi:uncharacterized protein